MSVPFKLLAPQDVLEAYYANVQRSTTLFMVMLDTEGKVVAMNRALAKLYGKTPDEMIGMDWLAVMIPGKRRDEMTEVFKRILATGLPDVYENPVALPDGTERIILWSNTLMRSGDQLTGTLSFGIDITESARAQQTLKRSEYLLRRAEEIARLGTYILDVNTGIWTSSRVLDDIFGIGPENPRNVDSWGQLIHPDDRNAMLAYFKEEVLGNHRPFDREYRIVRSSDSQVRWVHGHGELEIAPDGTVSIMIGAIQDITDQRLTALREAGVEEGYRTLFDFAPLGIARLGLDKRFLEVNPAFASMLGRTPDEMVGKTIADITWPEDREIGMAEIESVVRGQQASASVEKRYLHSNGSVVWGRVTISVVRDHTGTPQYLLPIVRDITLEKNATDQLRLSDERYRLAASHAHMLVYDWDITNDVLEWEGAIKPLTGFEQSQFPAQTIDGWTELIHPDDRAAALQLLERAQKERRQYHTTYRLRCSDNRYITVEDEGTFLYNDRGAPIRMIGTMRDVTESHRERSLVDIVLSSSADMVVIIDRSGVITYANDQAFGSTGLGYARSELIGMNAFSIIHPDDQAQAQSDFARDVVHEGVGKPTILRLRTKNGAYRYYELVGRNLPPGSPIQGRIIHTRDVSAFIETEERLRQSEARFRDQAERLAAILEGTNQGSWEWNVQTGETVFNEQWARIIGYTLKELEPLSIKTWERFAHPDDLKKSDVLLQEHFAGTTPFYEFEGRMKHKDGHWVWVLDRGRVKSWTKDGKPLMMAGTHTDITTLKTSSERLTKIIDTMSEGFAEHEMIFDAQGRPVDYRFLRVNPAFERLTGLKAADLIGKTVKEVLPATEDVWIARAGEVVRTGVPATFTSVSTEVGGKTFHITDWRTEPGRFGSIFSDVTSDVREEQSFKKILNASLDMFTIVDDQGVCQFQSDQSKPLTGYEPAELVGISIFSHIHPDDLADVTPHFQRALTDANYHRPVQFRFRRKDGTWLWLEAIGAQWDVEPGKKGLVISSRDVSQIRSQQQIAERTKELETINKALIGRELRINELKEQVRTLTEELTKVRGT